jgi:hypothetical protein
VTQKVAYGEASLQKVASIIAALNPKVEWRIDIRRHIGRRTVSQNKLYFAVLTEMANETGHTKDEMHDAMKTKFLPQQVVNLGGEEVYIPSSSAKLDKATFTEYVEKVMAFAASELGIQV